MLIKLLNHTRAHNSITNMASRKRAKSNVWDYFEKLSNSSIKCKECLKQLTFSGNTTNLWDHLKRKHRSKDNLANNNDLSVVDCENAEIEENDQIYPKQSNSSQF